MDKKQLKRLNRKELIDIIYEQKKRELELVSQLEEAQKELENRTIKISKSGSIAEAALKLNEVFEAAQKAADEYVASVKSADIKPTKTVRPSRKSTGKRNRWHNKYKIQ